MEEQLMKPFPEFSNIIDRLERMRGLMSSIAGEQVTAHLYSQMNLPQTMLDLNVDVDDMEPLFKSISILYREICSRCPALVAPSV